MRIIAWATWWLQGHPGLQSKTLSQTPKQNKIDALCVYIYVCACVLMHLRVCVLILFHVYIYLAYMYVCAPCVFLVPVEAEYGIGFLEIGVTGSCEYHMGAGS